MNEFFNDDGTYKHKYKMQLLCWKFLSQYEHHVDKDKPIEILLTPGHVNYPSTSWPIRVHTNHSLQLVSRQIYGDFFRSYPHQVNMLCWRIWQAKGQLQLLKSYTNSQTELLKNENRS